MKSPILTFDWPTRHRIHLLLPLGVFIAALLHAAIFFLFAVKHPEPSSDGPNQARLYFLASSSQESSQIESALFSLDPSLFAPGRGLPEQSPPPAATYTPQYAKSTMTWEEPPLRLRKDREDRDFKGPVRIPHKKPAKPAATLERPTQVLASPDISSRFTEIPDAPKFQIHPTRPLEPANFLVALSPTGQVLHAVSDKSSGDSELDRAAMNFLRQLRFLPSDKTETAWGFLEFHWGSDLPSPLAP